MKTILHNVDIAASPQAVYDGLTTQKGLAGWWTATVDATQDVGGVIDFRFGASFNPDMEITALDPRKRVAWKCVGGHEPWEDNTFEFRIEPRDSGCVLRRSQVDRAAVRRRVQEPAEP